MLTLLYAALNEARAAHRERDHVRARERIRAAIDRALGELRARKDLAAAELLEQMGMLAHNLGELSAAEAAMIRVIELRSSSLPDEHPDVQRARLNLAATLYVRGDFHGAREIQERVVDVFARTLPADHRLLQTARLNLASMAKELGDLRQARELEEGVLASRLRTLPEDHPDVQQARVNLSGTLIALGDLLAARAVLERVLAIQLRTLPDDDPSLQHTRLSLGSVLNLVGDTVGAAALEERVVAVRSRTLPDEHPDLQIAQFNLSQTLSDLGDLARARALGERVLEIRSRTLPDDHPHLQLARLGLAVTLYRLGDFPGARALFEQALDVCSRTLPDDHHDLRGARQGLALTLYELGDLSGARVLFEKIFDVCSSTLPEDHPDSLAARQNVAIILFALGDHQGARELFEQALETSARARPDDHRNLHLLRQCLSASLLELGELAAARALAEKALEAGVLAIPDDDAGLQKTRGNLAGIIAAEWARASPDERALEADRKRCVEVLEARCRAQTSVARSALLAASPREAEARCQSASVGLDFTLSMALGLGGLPPSPELERACFVQSETMRGAALSSAAAMRRAARSPRYAELRTELAVQQREIAALVGHGATSASFQQAVARRERVERELVRLAQEQPEWDARALDLDVDALAAALGARDAIVAYRLYVRSSFITSRGGAPGASEASSGERTASNTGTGRVPETRVRSLCAFVVRAPSTEANGPPTSALSLIDLGPVEPVEAAVRGWRAALGVAAGRGLHAEPRGEPRGEPELLEEYGHAIRRLVFEPLAHALSGATRIVVVPDDVLHLVSFDALPSGASAGELLGDRLRIEARATLTELPDPAARAAGLERLVAVGDVAFDSTPHSGGTETPASDAEHLRLAALETRVQAREPPGVMRGSEFGGFGPLPATGAEVEALAESYAEAVSSDAAATILSGAQATRERLVELAPRSRWLHVATHGWFASESIGSWSDAEPIDAKSGLAFRQSSEEQVKGMSPMLLCGLALAGANSPDDEIGRSPGLITAEEISALDLSGCELAVLSACDTNVGERRAGQGVASLQRALQMAGARSVITSLWKVPDEATKDLMLDFYRRLWVEKKPKHQALWEAKTKLRDAKDEKTGKPKYTTRDWAAWVLTGDPE